MNNQDIEQDIEQEIEYISKSQVKREMRELQKMGEKLVKLSVSQLKSIDMPEELLTAVINVKNTHSFIAERRCIQYIGTIMRKIDPDPIRHALDNLARGIPLTSKKKIPENPLMNHLLAGGKKAFEELIEKHPNLDRQHVNQLIRLASKEIKTGKKAKHRNTLLRILKKLEEE